MCSGQHMRSFGRDCTLCADQLAVRLTGVCCTVVIGAMNGSPPVSTRNPSAPSPLSSPSEVPLSLLPAAPQSAASSPGCWPWSVPHNAPLTVAQSRLIAPISAPPLFSKFTCQPLHTAHRCYWTPALPRTNLTTILASQHVAPMHKMLRRCQSACMLACDCCVSCS